MATVEIVTGIFLLLLGVAFLIEIVEIKKLKEQGVEYETMNENLIEVFAEVKRVTNTNSTALRGTQAEVLKHAQLLELLSTLVDLHSEVLKIRGSVREAFETEVDTDIEDVLD